MGKNLNNTSQPIFSLIMPSYLGNYKNAAAGREQKILRAINSVYAQTYENWELILVSDGCEKTNEMFMDNQLIYDERLRFISIDKQPMWSGMPRNVGINNAKGRYISYVDIDDYLGINHLQKIADGLSDYDWVWFDDLRYDKKNISFFVNPCELKLGRCGTSNIVHKTSMKSRWLSNTYAHDYNFIVSLVNESKSYAKIAPAEYFVCHIPTLYDI